MLDQRIVGATVVSGRGTDRLDVGVSQGVFAGLYAPGAAPQARQTLDADGLLMLPGIIDGHFHCRAPGHPEREDFDSGTQAAAAGGATTILEMPIAHPGVHTPEILRDRQQLAAANSHVDFALWGGGGVGSDIRGMAAEGAVGFKLFLHAAPEGREVEFEGLTAVDNASLYASLRDIGSTGLPAAIHCEDNELIEVLTAELKAAGKVSASAHEASRPAFVEALAVSKVLIIAEWLGTRVHFPHISTEKAVSLISDAKRRGMNASLETCPHYLLFDDSVLETMGPFAKINPPIRPIGNREALWAGITNGAVDTIGSDHAPYTFEEKEAGWENIFRAPAGSPSVETMGPAIWDRALAGDLTLSRSVELLSERPADIFGLAPRKGHISPGADADFVLLDPAATWTISTSDLHSRSARSARLYEGRKLNGRIQATYLRGALAYEAGQVQNDPGTGQFLRSHGRST